MFFDKNWHRLSFSPYLTHHSYIIPQYNTYIHSSLTYSRTSTYISSCNIGRLSGAEIKKWDTLSPLTAVKRDLKPLKCSVDIINVCTHTNTYTHTHTHFKHIFYRYYINAHKSSQCNFTYNLK